MDAPRPVHSFECFRVVLRFGVGRDLLLQRDDVEHTVVIFRFWTNYLAFDYPELELRRLKFLSIA